MHMCPFLSIHFLPLSPTLSLNLYAHIHTHSYLNQSILRAANIQGSTMDAVNGFVHFRNLPPKLRATIHEYFQKINASFQSKELFQNEKEVLGLMPPWLRDDVISTINRNIVRSIPLFDKVIRLLQQHHTHTHIHTGIIGGGGGGGGPLTHTLRPASSSGGGVDTNTNTNTSPAELFLQRLIDIMCAKIFRPDEFIVKEGM